MRRFPIFRLLLATIALSACSRPEPATPVAAEAATYTGREDTRALQNADTVGYDGTGIQKKLDAALDQNDRRAADLDAQIDAQAGGAAPADDGSQR